MSVLIETNIIIDFLRQRGPAVAYITALTDRPSVSAVTVAELYAGARTRREEAHIERLLDGSNVLPVTLDIARTAGQHMKHFGASHGLDDFDALIAATAEHHGLPLATLNVKHFPMLKGLKAAW